MNPDALEFCAVDKSFSDGRGGRLQVLQQISLSVPVGQVTALLGPSGCGKSTLLHLAAGLSEPDGGRIMLFGRPLGPDTDWRPVSYLFQEDRLLPWRTALGNVELALEPFGSPRAERRARAISSIERVGLAEFLDVFPHQMSGGMRSRLALARSITVRPALLLMDEPFTGLDADTKAMLHALFMTIRKESAMTVVLVTHDVQEATLLSDRAIRLSARPARLIEEISALDSGMKAM